jgi:hypothetical protein
MCLLVVAWRSHAVHRVVLAANRDEYHGRAAAPMAVWDSPPHILAGRDLQAGGAWLGVDRRRRFGIITNYRELTRAGPGAPSRGELIPRYLDSARERRRVSRQTSGRRHTLCGLQPAARRRRPALVCIQSQRIRSHASSNPASTVSAIISSTRPGQSS